MSEKQNRTYRKSAKVLIGRQGAILRTVRDYDEPLPKRAPVASDVLATGSLDAGVEIARLLSRATKMWKSQSKQHFADFVTIANFGPIMNTGQDSTMVTLKYEGIDPNRWKNLWGWTSHFRKQIEQLYKMGKGAWGADFAMMAHLEFETTEEQRPHWHVWLAPRDGKSNYPKGSRYYHPKAGVNGLVFWRWLEAAWALILDVKPDLVAPTRTWIASEREMEELYGQDAETPIRVSRYWMKDGKSPEMIAKRRQLMPPAEWMKRGMIFRYVCSFGLGMDYVALEDLKPEQEAEFRAEISKDIPEVITIEETGEVRNVARLSVDGTQGGRQYAPLTDERRQELATAAGG
jgi:hypothetical protein